MADFKGTGVTVINPFLRQNARRPGSFIGEQHGLIVLSAMKKANNGNSSASTR
jgi:hypothetical protein